jgi:hypothetical protein
MIPMLSICDFWKDKIKARMSLVQDNEQRTVLYTIHTIHTETHFRSLFWTNYLTHLEPSFQSKQSLLTVTLIQARNIAITDKVSSNVSFIQERERDKKMKDARDLKYYVFRSPGRRGVPAVGKARSESAQYRNYVDVDVEAEPLTRSSVVTGIQDNPSHSHVQRHLFYQAEQSALFSPSKRRMRQKLWVAGIGSLMVSICAATILILFKGTVHKSDGYSHSYSRAKESTTLTLISEEVDSISGASPQDDEVRSSISNFTPSKEHDQRSKPEGTKKNKHNAKHPGNGHGHGHGGHKNNKYDNHAGHGKAPKSSQEKSGHKEDKFSDEFLENLWPKVALLASFPNSGTSYTLTNVLHTSNVTTASNYCTNADRRDKGDVNVRQQPVYADTPYWEHGPTLNLHPGYNQSIAMPTKYVFTKTHCGARCTNCDPSMYMVSQDQFEHDCLKTCHEDHSNFKQHKKYSYDMRLVHKLVHLIRHPLDNVISRFHLHVKHSIRDSSTNTPNFEKSREGFEEYCSTQDFSKKYVQSGVEEEAYGEKLWTLAQRVPCHADVLRYVRWHNYMLEMVRRHSHLQQRGEHGNYSNTHIVYYEDYQEATFNTTVKSLLNFMDMDWVGEPNEFYFADYSDYYDAYLDDIREFVMEAASKELWPLLERYFD